MTREERHQRWQEIFDRYDKAVGEAYETTSTLSEQLAPVLTELINHFDAVAERVGRIARAVHEANHAALALYRDEQDS